MRYSSTEGTWSRNILPPQALQDGARLAGHPAGLGARQEAEDSDRGRGGDSEREGGGHLSETTSCCISSVRVCRTTATRPPSAGPSASPAAAHQHHTQGGDHRYMPRQGGDGPRTRLPSQSRRELGHLSILDRRAEHPRKQLRGCAITGTGLAQCRLFLPAPLGRFNVRPLALHGLAQVWPALPPPRCLAWTPRPLDRLCDIPAGGRIPGGEVPCRGHTRCGLRIQGVWREGRRRSLPSRMDTTRARPPPSYRFHVSGRAAPHPSPAPLDTAPRAHAGPEPTSHRHPTRPHCPGTHEGARDVPRRSPSLRHRPPAARRSRAQHPAAHRGPDRRRRARIAAARFARRIAPEP